MSGIEEARQLIDTGIEYVDASTEDTRMSLESLVASKAHLDTAIRGVVLMTNALDTAGSFMQFAQTAFIEAQNSFAGATGQTKESPNSAYLMGRAATNVGESSGFLSEIDLMKRQLTGETDRLTSGVLGILNDLQRRHQTLIDQITYFTKPRPDDLKSAAKTLRNDL